MEDTYFGKYGKNYLTKIIIYQTHQTGKLEEEIIELKKEIKELNKQIKYKKYLYI